MLNFPFHCWALGIVISLFQSCRGTSQLLTASSICSSVVWCPWLQRFHLHVSSYFVMPFKCRLIDVMPHTRSRQFCLLKKLKSLLQCSVLQLELERSVRVMFIIFHSVHSKPWALCLGLVHKSKERLNLYYGE